MEHLVALLAGIPGVTAVTLGGSRATRMEAVRAALSVQRQLEAHKRLAAG